MKPKLVGSRFRVQGSKVTTAGSSGILVAIGMAAGWRRVTQAIDIAIKIP